MKDAAKAVTDVMMAHIFFFKFYPFKIICLAFI